MNNDLPSVGTEDARALAAMLIVHAGDHKDVAYECDMNPVHTRNWKHYETSLSASKALLALVSERDELAGRVRELGQDAARYRVIRDWGASFMDDQEKPHHVCEAAMDAVIDAAISTKKGGAAFLAGQQVATHPSAATEPSDAERLDWNTSMKCVQAMLGCTSGELECIGEKLLDTYIDDVNRVYAAIRATKGGKL